MTNSRVIGSYFPSWLLANAFDREMDLSFPQDGRALSDEQDGFLRTYIKEQGIEKIKTPYSVQQVHGDEIVIVQKKDEIGALFANNNTKDSLMEADGIITDLVGLPIMVRTADCVPVFIFDEKFRVIGLVHAGWRSTHLGIVKKAVNLICEHWSSEPDNMKIVFGPAIRSCCYEVGAEFEKKFNNSISKRDGSFWLDLVEENRYQLQELFRGGKNIFDCGICTCCIDRYFSYRREGALAGRNLSVMMIKGE